MKNADLPAMPITITEHTQYCFKDATLDMVIGLTKREYFAGLAMQGILANSGGVIQANSYSGSGWVNSDEHDLAVVAVKCADAVLAELERAK